MNEERDRLTEEEIITNDRIAAEEYAAYIESCEAEDKEWEESEPNWFNFGFGFRF